MVCNAKFRADIGLIHLPFQEEEEEKRRRRKGHPNQPPSKSTGRNDGGQLLNGRPPKATAAIDAPVWLCHSYNCINRWKEIILPRTKEQPMMGEESMPHISLPWAAYGTRLSLPMPALVAEKTICHGEGACKTSIHAERARSLPLRYRNHGGDAGSGYSRVR